MNLQDELFNSNVRVENVIVKGLKRTNEHIVMRELENVKRSGTLEEIKDSLFDVHANLMNLGIFKAVDISIDEGIRKSPNSCAIIVHAEESNIATFHSGTYVQGTEGTVEANFQLNNPVGYAEQISAGIEYGTPRTNLFSVTYSIPKPMGYPVIGDVRLQQLITDREPWSSFVERFRGGIVTVVSENGQHGLSYELGWRRLSDFTRRASRSTISELGDQIKSSIKYNFSVSALDNTDFPRNGWSMRASTELAGVGTDPKFIRFTRHQVNGQVAFPVGEDAALHVEGGAGVLLPWGGQKTSICDRFFLGGVSPDGLRGFKFRGVGSCDARRPGADQGVEEPQVRTDALGGDLSWCVLAALRFGLPIESLKGTGLRGQVFVNAGNLAQVGSGRSFRDVVNDLAGTFRCSVGAGIIWPMTIGRLEVNFAHVLRKQASDQIRNGIQFGFTTSF